MSTSILSKDQFLQFLSSGKLPEGGNMPSEEALRTMSSPGVRAACFDLAKDMIHEVAVFAAKNPAITPDVAMQHIAIVASYIGSAATVGYDMARGAGAPAATPPTDNISVTISRETAELLREYTGQSSDHRLEKLYCDLDDLL